MDLLALGMGLSREEAEGTGTSTTSYAVRYAKGEITKEQFDQMTRDLQESNPKTQKPT